jgi:hypothetical protein
VNAKHIRAQSLVIVDEVGKERLRLDTNMGRPVAALFDGRGTARLMLTLQEGGSPAASFYDENGVCRGSVGLIHEGEQKGALVIAFGNTEGEMVGCIAESNVLEAAKAESEAEAAAFVERTLRDLAADEQAEEVV